MENTNAAWTSEEHEHVYSATGGFKSVSVLLLMIITFSYS